MAFNYSRCITQAKKLQSMAGEYQSLDNALNSLSNNSSSYWQGQSNYAFKEELAEWRCEAMSIKNEMELLSILIKRVARQVRDEEMADQ